MRGLWIGLLCCSAMLVALAACGTEAPPEEGTPSDTLHVAVSDSLAVDTTAVDSLVLPPPAEELVLAADSLARDAAAGDTLAALQATLTALRLEVARLSGAVMSLERTNTRLLQARPPSAGAPPDTAHTTAVVAPERLQAAAKGVQQFGGRVVIAFLLIALSYFVIRGFVWLLETLSERSAKRRLFFKKLIPIARLTVWGATIYFVLSVIFQLDRDSLLAASAALGVAIGFAGQDILKNIFGGILIIFDQPFQVGDKINVGGTYGEVVSIGLRSTRIVTPDDNLVSVPNSQVVDSQVANANAGALDCQVVVDLFLPGWVDVKRAKSIAYGAAANSRYVFLGKPIVVNVKDVFKETFLTQLKVKAYVLDTRYESIFASDVTEAAKGEFLREGLLRPIGDVRPDADVANGTPEGSSKTNGS